LEVAFIQFKVLYFIPNCTVNGDEATHHYKGRTVTTEEVGRNKFFYYGYESFWVFLSFMNCSKTIDCSKNFKKIHKNLKMANGPQKS
jgi:hypothetical protein